MKACVRTLTKLLFVAIPGFHRILPDCLYYIYMPFNILLVEDNNSFRRTLVEILIAHFATMNITEVASGEDALIKADELHPDMIFMDINLPGENGLETTRKIKQRHQHTLIIILTSHDVPEYRQQAFHNGADYFISKADDSCVVDIIARIEKAMVNKRTQSGQQSVGASRRALLRQFITAPRTVCRMPDCMLPHVCFERPHSKPCSRIVHIGTA